MKQTEAPSRVDRRFVCCVSVRRLTGPSNARASVASPSGIKKVAAFNRRS